jgi:hypothetical protein
LPALAAEKSLGASHVSSLSFIGAEFLATYVFLIITKQSMPRKLFNIFGGHFLAFATYRGKRAGSAQMSCGIH